MVDKLKKKFLQSSNLIFRVAESASLVSTEEAELKTLKGILGTQGTLRPIFEGQLRQRRTVRERAMALRKLVAESGIDYDALSEIYKSKSDGDVRPVLKTKLSSVATDSDLDELVTLLNGHFLEPVVTTNGNHEEGNQNLGEAGDAPKINSIEK